ncbi:branched-chain amino acid ABC transporter [Paenibacillus chitinolyticus]|uniref:AzlD domain-containing protein n=1 Tax=Paenibacillus chitinolyticus TaxID=79263 RepID=A0A410X0C0_9BACL|nr:AzlD domain-containing protein [Paenibacillus chitinolyticus]MCY9590093.1 AzlD domain-containing protein [Paenibacillus chitinolyticus]MCY9596789.1 AzlD domain-containing protein [Paenibacillus chitinolyticus]QAV19892.1 branched-chain amino acid ABC transporter [Paenibacillus chitinolyticus]
MEVSELVLWIIAGSAAVTWIPRVLPLLVLSRMKLPEWGIRWLQHVPVAVMAALLAQELLLTDGRLSVADNAYKLLAALPALAVAVYTRSLFGTVIAGVLSLAAFRLFF